MDEPENERPAGQVTILKSLYLQYQASGFYAVLTEGRSSQKLLAAIGMDSFEGGGRAASYTIARDA